MSHWPGCAEFHHFKSLALELFCLLFMLVFAKRRKGVRCLDVVLRPSEMRGPGPRSSWVERKDTVLIGEVNSESFVNLLSPILLLFSQYTRRQIRKLYGENVNCTFHSISYLLKCFFSILKKPPKSVFQEAAFSSCSCVLIGSRHDYQ